MPPSQNYKSSHRGFSLAELTAAAVIMVGIWLGALAYMNAASEEFEEAKEETLDNAPKEDIAILTEIRAAERALVASEALTEEAREAWEAAAAAVEAAEKRENAYRQLLQNALGSMDTLLQNGAWPSAADINTDDTAWTGRSGRHYYIHPKNNREWPERSVAAKLCRAKMLDREGWSCQILDNAGAPYWLIRITVPESALGSN